MNGEFDVQSGSYAAHRLCGGGGFKVVFNTLKRPPLPAKVVPPPPSEGVYTTLEKERRGDYTARSLAEVRRAMGYINPLAKRGNVASPPIPPEPVQVTGRGTQATQVRGVMRSDAPTEARPIYGVYVEPSTEPVSTEGASVAETRRESLNLLSAKLSYVPQTPRAKALMELAWRDYSASQLVL